jgi:hypothetical protein
MIELGIVVGKENADKCALKLYGDTNGGYFGERLHVAFEQLNRSKPGSVLK